MCLPLQLLCTFSGLSPRLSICSRLALANGACGPHPSNSSLKPPRAKNERTAATCASVPS